MLGLGIIRGREPEQRCFATPPPSSLSGIVLIGSGLGVDEENVDSSSSECIYPDRAVGRSRLTEWGDKICNLITLSYHTHIIPYPHSTTCKLVRAVLPGVVVGSNRYS